MLGISSKESIYCLPLILLCYAWIYKKVNFIKYCYPFFAIVAVHLAVILLVFPNTSAYLDDIKGTLINIKWLVVKFTTTLEMLFIPFDFQGETVFFGSIYKHSILLSLVILFCLLCFLRYVVNKDFKFTLAWLSLSILPSLFARPDIILEKYLYLPLVPTSVFISLLIYQIIKSNWLRVLIIIILCCSLYGSFCRRYIDHHISTKLVHRLLEKEKKILLSYPKTSAVYHVNFPYWINRVEAFAPTGMRNLDYFYLKDKELKERSNICFKREGLNCKLFKFSKEMIYDKNIFLLYQDGEIIDVTPLLIEHQ